MFDANTIIAILIPALIQVESGGGLNTSGDYNEKTGEWEAIGVLQQHKIFVKEVNRILRTKWGKKHYPSTPDFHCWPFPGKDDRCNPVRAKLMTQIWLECYGENRSVETCIRMYNAGSNWRGKQAEKYWLKVKAELEKQGVQYLKVEASK